MLSILVWSGVTIAIYLLCRALHARRPVWWSHPQLLGFALLLAIVILSHTNYASYRQGSAPLVWLLGPSVVAFAVPIYDQRALILRRWRVLLVAVSVGSCLSALISWEMARALMLSPELRESLIPRSVSAPFAMIVAGRLGGTPGLAATFTSITGLLGATLAQPISRLLKLRSKFARGAMLGMGAHGTGTARAFLWGVEEGTVAATTMSLAGLANVVVAVIWVSL